MRLVRLDRFGPGWKLKFVADDADEFWDAVDELKRRVPNQARKWIPEEKSWYVEDWYLSRLSDLFENFNEMRTNGTHAKKKSTRAAGIPAPVRQSFALLHLLPDAPPEIVKAAYRACASLYHPDHGGDVEHMKQVNLAFELAYQWSMQHRKASA